MSDERFLRKTGYRQTVGQTDRLTNMNSQDLPANVEVQQILKKNTKIINKSRRKK